jgi:hypothetical protein
MRQRKNPALWLDSHLAVNKDYFGGQGQNRTADTGIFSPLLYQLSYLAVYGN